MAPKKDEEKKPPEKPATPGAPAKPPGDGKPGMFTVLIVHKTFRNIVILVTVIMISACIGMGVLYAREWTKTDELFKAMETIHDFMGRLNAENKNASASTVLSEVRRIAEELMSWNNLNEDVEAKVDTQQKLKAGWLAFLGYLWFFSKQAGTYADAKWDCLQRKALLGVIIRDREEGFLEETVRRLAVSHWLGLYRQRYDWHWESGALLHSEDRIYFWKQGSPEPAVDITKNLKKCAAIIPCTESRRCWEDFECETKKNWICKFEPDIKLIF
ncbi:C-type lectin domain family 4 member E-like isoform X2 [Paroedura picta]|uniref:C-type lectin domain family 4 member E-like isoform X2 n=1 Tax=Paroedura picta TaxID=143630 RepID=UPI004057B815